jgi:hypothetical protein
VTEDLKSEVESRLDYLFHEDEEPTESIDRLGGVGDHPLKALKAVLLSVEWEITDSSLESLINELKTLEDFYKDDKLILAFLRLLNSIARYIKARKGKSHPGATSLLTSVYNGLEKVALSEGMNRKEKEKILLQEVEKFKRLKEDVIRRKMEEKEEEIKEEQKEEVKEEVTETVTIPPIEAGRPDTEKPLPDTAGMTSHELFVYALEEIKEVIRAEFRALRAEIKLWRESR